MPTRDDLAFAKAAIRLGHLTSEQASLAMQQAGSDAGGSARSSLGERLVVRGTLTRSQYNRIRAEVETSGTTTPKGRSSSSGEFPCGGVVGGIRLERLLGSGAMGDVYLGHHPGLDKNLAVKILAPHLASDGVLRERFLREARALAKLEHPNVVRVTNVGDEGEVNYMAMEYAAGGTLEELVSAHPHGLPLDRAIQLVTQVAAGLAAAHAAGIVHRDLKPANVLIAEGGQAKLGDFGLARDTTRVGPELSQQGQILGTPHFMSPEQCLGEPADSRSDVYSLGAVLYNVLTGRRLYPEDRMAAVVSRHLRGDFVPVRNLRRDAPSSLVRVLSRMLAREPGDRFADASEVLAALETGRGVGPGRRLDRRSKIALASVLALVAAFAAWFTFRSRVDPEPTESDRGSAGSAVPRPSVASTGEHRGATVHPSSGNSMMERLFEITRQLGISANLEAVIAEFALKEGMELQEMEIEELLEVVAEFGAQSRPMTRPAIARAGQILAEEIAARGRPLNALRLELAIAEYYLLPSAKQESARRIESLRSRLGADGIQWQRRATSETFVYEIETGSKASGPGVASVSPSGEFVLVALEPKLGRMERCQVRLTFVPGGAWIVKLDDRRGDADLVLAIQMGEGAVVVTPALGGKALEPRELAIPDPTSPREAQVEFSSLETGVMVRFRSGDFESHWPMSWQELPAVARDSRVRLELHPETGDVRVERVEWLVRR